MVNSTLRNGFVAISLIASAASCKSTNSQNALKDYVDVGSNITINVLSSGATDTQALIAIKVDQGQTMPTVQLCLDALANCGPGQGARVDTTATPSQSGGTAYTSSQPLALNSGRTLTAVVVDNSNQRRTVEFKLVAGANQWSAQTGNQQSSNDTGGDANPTPVASDPLVPNPSGVQLNDVEFRMVRLTNIERRRLGLSMLIVNPTLMTNTRAWATNVASRSASNQHSGQNVAENAFYSVPTPEAAIAGWIASPEHHQNMINSSYTKIGVGVAYDGNGVPYWYQQFIW